PNPGRAVSGSKPRVNTQRVGKDRRSRPAGRIELGYRLCYGSPKDEHLVRRGWERYPGQWRTEWLQRGRVRGGRRVCFISPARALRRECAVQDGGGQCPPGVCQLVALPVV